eukprot:gene42124-biopygen5666
MACGDAKDGLPSASSNVGRQTNTTMVEIAMAYPGAKENGPDASGPTTPDSGRETRKIWSKLIVRRIVRAWDQADIMHNAQQGFRTAMSTMTAILQYVNAVEEAQELKLPIHRSSWDMTKAFDTVSKNAMMLAWLRLGVPMDIALWLVELDRSGVIMVRTPAAKKAWKDRHYQGIQAPGNLYSASMR